MELVRRMRAQQLEPAAMMAVRERGGWDVYVRFEGFGAGVRAQRDKLRELEESAWPEPAPPGRRVRFGALPSNVAQVAKALAPLGGRLEWLPTLGLGSLSSGSADAAALQGARRELMALGGWMLADGDWGPAPSSLALQRSVKKQLDPGGLLGPGRFIA